MEKRDIFFLSCLAVLGILFGVSMRMYIQERSEQSAVYLFKTINFAGMTEDESEYLTRGWDIIDIYSSKSSKDSMTKECRVTILAENKKLADAFGYSRYGALASGIMETALNPNIIHEPYGEVGMFGAWYGTARDYYRDAEERMPGRLWQLVNFSFTKRSDLLDPVNALKMYYIFMWVCYDKHSGDPLWSITAYRFGRFIEQHYKGSDSLFPEKFVIYTKYGKMTYNPRAYYWTWRNMVLNFERGCLEVGVYEKWKKEQYKMSAEQIEF